MRNLTKEKRVTTNTKIGILSLRNMEKPLKIVTWNKNADVDKPHVSIVNKQRKLRNKKKDMDMK